MNALPVDRALRIYGALANRSETKGARERLTKHLMKMYIQGEKDQHRLTVEGLSYLRNLDQEIDSATSSAALFSLSRRGLLRSLLVVASVAMASLAFRPLASLATLVSALPRRARQVAFSWGR